MQITNDQRLITYGEALARLGFSKRTLFDRIKESGIVVYVDGTNRCRRLIAEQDLWKLNETKPRRQVAA